MEQSHLHRITINPKMSFGKPTIRGLRYTVHNVLEWLASSMSYDDILEDYPDLEREDILACLEYAAKITEVKTVATSV